MKLITEDCNQFKNHQWFQCHRTGTWKKGAIKKRNTKSMNIYLTQSLNWSRMAFGDLNSVKNKIKQKNIQFACET